MSKNISNLAVSDVTGEAYQTPHTQIDSPSSLKETTYFFSDWQRNFDDYHHNPHLKNAIKLRTIWTFGGGVTPLNSETTVTIGHINGTGKERFEDILMNLDRQLSIGGDCIALITRREDGRLLNLKPLNLGDMAVVVDDKGMIVRYEQHKAGPSGKAVITFEPEEIFHLSLDRIGDEIHGRSLIPSLKKVLDAWNENFDDRQRNLHWLAKPLIIFKLKTDDTTKIAKFQENVDDCMKKSKNNILYLPDDEDIAKWEVVQIPPSPILLEQANALRKDFYSTIGSPELLSDSSGSTESGGKIGYLTFEHVVGDRQLFWERQLLTQLGLSISINPPSSIQPALSEDQAADGMANMLNFQPSDAIAGVGR